MKFQLAFVLIIVFLGISSTLAGPLGEEKGALPENDLLSPKNLEEAQKFVESLKNDPEKRSELQKTLNKIKAATGKDGILNPNVFMENLKEAGEAAKIFGGASIFILHGLLTGKLG